MRQTPVAFRSKDVERDGVIVVPQGLDGPYPAAVLCHGHPVFGQDMESPLMMAVARALDDAGIASLRFNFRLAGGQQGDSSQDETDIQSVESALNLVKRWPGLDRKRTALVGYSFGAQVMLRGLLEYKQARSLVFISPPLSSFAQSAVDKDKRPKLFLAGGKDRLAKADELQKLVAGFPAFSAAEVIPDADHSWRGHEATAAQRVAGFLLQTL